MLLHVSFYSQIIFHCLKFYSSIVVPTPQFVYPFITWWTFGHLGCFPFFFYYKLCCHEYLWSFWVNTCFHFSWIYVSVSSVAQSCLTLFDPMDCSTPGLSVDHQLLGLIQTHVYRVGGAIQPSHPLSSPSPHAFNLSQHEGLFQWVSSSHQVDKIL